MKNFDASKAKSSQTQSSACNVGVVGIGVMGGNLALNIAQKGYRTAIFDTQFDNVSTLFARCGRLGNAIVPTFTMKSFIAAMSVPRVIVLMVPAGPAVDQIIAEMSPLLDAEDVIVDAGNSNFTDTRRRAGLMTSSGPYFLGAGVSGGEQGARHGPAIMAGGDRGGWDRAAAVLTAIAARHGSAPCADYVGEAGAGHLVKTVHNGIEYGDMQMIAETFGIMRDGMSMRTPQMAEMFERWNLGRLQSYLIEITGQILRSHDSLTGKEILDVIVDSAGQKGTGRWTAIEAIRLGAPSGVAQAAIEARVLSSKMEERQAGAALFSAAVPNAGLATLEETDLEQALIAGKIISYAQGFGIILDAAKDNGWEVSLANVARIWRGGCIIRSGMLEDMAHAYEAAPQGNLMHSEVFSAELAESLPALRKVVSTAALSGVPTPALSSALAYFEMARTRRSTADMIQAQRDFFGAHGFHRTDTSGSGFHGPWSEAQGAA